MDHCEAMAHVAVVSIVVREALEPKVGTAVPAGDAYGTKVRRGAGKLVRAAVRSAIDPAALGVLLGTVFWAGVRIAVGPEISEAAIATNGAAIQPQICATI